MEFNQLPDGHEGPQKRQTEFASPEEKLGYDANNLIALAKDRLGKDKVSVREALDFATRDDDNLEDLRKAIAIKLKEKSSDAVEPAPAKPEKELSPEQKAVFFATLEKRIAGQPELYKGIQWPSVKNALKAADKRLLYGLFQMEENGHEVGVEREQRSGKNGFRFDSYAAESPAKIRNVHYFDAEKIVKEWNSNGAVNLDLMTPEVFRELRAKGIIKNNNSWDQLKTENPGTPENPGISFCGRDVGVDKNLVYRHSHHGGFRCSLWVSEA